MGTTKLLGKPDEIAVGGGGDLQWNSILVAILLVTSCYGNRDKLQNSGSLGSFVDLTAKVGNFCIMIKRNIEYW